VSSCLLGERVRFNGDHKRDRFVSDVLSRYVDWVPVCPEVEMGLGAPRESMRLVGDAEDPRLIAPKSETDHTAGTTGRSWSSASRSTAGASCRWSCR
jgi:uncharacterized protein YbbK (DUF523 family)